MARVAAFTAAGTPVGSRNTLAALMAKKKMLAEQQGTIMAPRQIESWTQGASQLAQTFVNALQQRRAANEETAGREQMAQAMAGIDWTKGPSPEQLHTITALDPDAGQRIMEQSAQKALDEYKYNRDIKRSDFEFGRTQADQIADEERAAAAAAGVTKDTRAFETGQEAAINEREKNEAAQVAADAAAAAKAAKQVKTVTGPEAEALGYDPTRQWEIPVEGGPAKDVTPDPKVAFTYRPATPEERAEYGVPEGQPLKMKVGSDGSVEPQGVGSAPPAPPTMPAEVAARVALGDEFLANYDEIYAAAAAGKMTGPIDYQMATRFGRGEGGDAYRKLKQGSESILRQMSGAGLNTTENVEKVLQYEPSITDDAATLVSKLEGLKSTVERMRGATVTRLKDEPAPGTTAPAGDLPEGVTEEDITATMQANNMTRQQVLEALKKQGGGNAGP